MTVPVMSQAAPPSEATPPQTSPPPDGRPVSWLDALSRWSARALAAGGDWDAVRITGSLAPHVYGQMYQQTCGNTGPVVIDAEADAHYWLVRPGYPAVWDFPRVRLCTEGTWVVLPPLERLVHRVHWLTRPRSDGGLVHAPLLHATIASAVTG